MSILTQYIGPEGAALERVGLAFEAVGYEAPTPDAPGADGAYCSNIMAQYTPHLTPYEVRAIIAFGLDNTRGFLRSARGDYSLNDVVRLHGDDDGDR